MTNHNLRVALVWSGTVFGERTFTQTSEPSVTVGERVSNHFVVADRGLGDQFEMFERTPQGYAFRFTDKVTGILTRGDDEVDLPGVADDGDAIGEVDTECGAARIFEVPIEVGDWGIVHIGTIDVFFQLMEPTERVEGRGLKRRIDGPLLGTMAVAALLHALILIAAFLTEQDDPNLRDLRAMDRFATILVDEPAEPLIEDDTSEDEVATAKTADGEEGKFGSEDAAIEEPQVPTVDGALVDSIDPRKIGVNDVLTHELIGAGPLKNIFGDQQGFEAKMDVAMSGDASQYVDGRGMGGMSLRGVGKGGGGDGFGSVYGLGEVHTGGGTGTSGTIARKERKRIEAAVEVGTPSSGDFCDPGNIRRVVGGKSNAVKYCFEKELQTQPELGGKVIAMWKIGLDGQVMSASIAESTMNNAKVEGCIQRVLKRMRFAKPDGGICVVNYPFVFSGLSDEVEVREGAKQ